MAQRERRFLAGREAETKGKTISQHQLHWYEYNSLIILEGALLLDSVNGTVASAGIQDSAISI